MATPVRPRRKTSSPKSSSPKSSKAKSKLAIIIKIKGPGRSMRVMRCVVKGRRTETACLPCGKESCEFKRTVTIMCCDEGNRTVCREVPGPWTATGRKCKTKTKVTGSAVATIGLDDGLDLVCTAQTGSKVREWCAARKSTRANIKEL